MACGAPEAGKGAEGQLESLTFSQKSDYLPEFSLSKN